MDNQIATISEQRDCTDFWQQWQQYQDHLYYCCVRWMDGNSSDAEDALSRAMLKAWEKAQKFTGKITNFKAWLTKLTRNLCVDIYRERSRKANRVEDIEAIAEEKELFLNNTPLTALETDEKKIAIRHAIDNLPKRLRETFILHFYQEFSHQEIVHHLGISYQNVCKRISQARTILRKELTAYFIGEYEIDTNLSFPSVVTEEISQNTEISECEVGEVETVVEVPEEIELSEQDCEEKLEAIVVGELSWLCVPCELHRFLFWDNLIEILVVLGNFFVALHRKQQQFLVGKRWGEILLPSRAPPCHG